MRIDGTAPAIDPNYTVARDSIAIQAENREVIRAVRAINASGSLGSDRELVFSLDRLTRRPVIKIVNRATSELVRQIPDEQVLHLAKQIKTID